MLEVKIRDWLQSITEEGALPSRCKGIYIGLFEGKSEYTIHFLGSLDFDAEDDDWACEDDEDYFPKHRYLQSGISTESGWELFLQDVIAALNNIRAEGNTILSQTSNLAVGFDSGDLVHL